MGDMKNRNKAKHKPLRPFMRYFMAICLALIVSIVVCFYASRPLWKTSMTYEYLDMPPVADLAAMASDPLKPEVLTPPPGRDPILSQMGILQSERFLLEIKEQLNTHGHPDWTFNQVKRAIRVTNPNQSALIQVDIQSPDKGASQLIARALDKAYLSYWRDLAKSPSAQDFSTLKGPIRAFHAAPKQPTLDYHPTDTLQVFLATFLGTALLLGIVPMAVDYQAGLIRSQPLLGIIESLLKSKKQEIILMIPVYSSGHVNAATHLGGLLNQFGRDSLIIDIDLTHRLLSRKIPLEHPFGVFEHLLYPDMKNPYLDPLSGARIIPLEATMDPEKIVEFSQVVQRIPRIWERWPGSVIILDISQWHEAYHLLLPYISQVIFYVPPYPHASSILLPKVFKGKYKVPVSVVEIQPEM